jgi:hypothetical protein
MMRKAVLILLAIWLLAPPSSSGQETEHFYNVDKEIRIEGKIQRIVMEPRYKDTSPFLIVHLEEKDTKKIYTVEISPAWFFDQDFHQGEYLTVTGSLTSSEEAGLNVIAREVQCKGETLILRDKHGFPTWRGGKGQMRTKGRRKGKRY